MSDGFNMDLKHFSKNLKASVPKFAKKVGIQAYAEIVVGTPIDEGTARANWWPSVNEPDQTVDESLTTPEMTKPLSLNVIGDEDIFISNSLPYIEELENGSSKQAPTGMVRVARDKLKAQIESGEIRP